MKLALYLIAIIVIALLVPFVIPFGSKPDSVDPNRNLPWQIDLDGKGGSAVFGISPGVSTLADVRRRLGPEIEVAIIAGPNEVGSLEGYYAQVPLGFVLARVIVTLEAAPDVVAAMRERASKAKHMESMTRQITLNPQDLALAENLPVRALNVIPTVNLDEATVVQRFGPPGERLAVSEKRVHLLYPDKGLDVVVDGDGKELLQYVAPRNFALLREPLRMNAGSTAGSQ